MIPEVSLSLTPVPVTPYHLDAVNVSLGDQTSERLGGKIPPAMCAERPNSGIFFGKKVYKKTRYYVSTPPGSDRSCTLIVGGQGCGKTPCIIIPTLRFWTGTFVAIDIKGDLLRHAVPFKTSKYPVKVFKFTDQQKDGNIKYCRYDPFSLLRKGGKNNLVRNAREIAEAIIPILPTDREPFWKQSAQNVLTAVILYVFGLRATGEDPGEVLTGSFNGAMELIQIMTIWDLIKLIEKSGNEDAIKYINQFRKIAVPEDNKILNGVSAELANSVMAFATDNRVRAAFDAADADDTLKWEDLTDHNVIIRLDEDQLDQWRGPVTMMLTQLIRSLERRPDKHSGNQCPPPVLLMLDEFPSLGKIVAIQKAFTTLRSRGVTSCIALQSIAQLDQIYGEKTRNIFLENCQYKAILEVTEPESQKMFSDMIGTINVVKKNISESVTMTPTFSGGNTMYTTFNGAGSASQPWSKTVSVGFSTTREPIVFPHELAAPKDILLVAEGKFYRVEKLPHYQQAIFPNIELQLPMYKPSLLDRLMDAMDSIAERVCDFFGF